ncbi:hypothetical protein D3C71_1397960 [compost metagenome]
MNYPVLLTNKGAVTERWRLQFTGPGVYSVIGEHLGVIVVGQSVTADCSPVGPSGVPYFTIFAAGLGQGWGQGNLVRFNTVAATFPFVVIRCVQMGAETVLDDSFEVMVRVGVDRP